VIFFGSVFLDQVGFFVAPKTSSLLTFVFVSVPVGELSSIAPRFFQVLRNVTENSLDMERMETILRAVAVDEAGNYESQPAKVIANDLTEFFLYGSGPEDVSRQNQSHICC
jgi:hypothetical protein